jgi:hypothetical protein
MWGNKSPTPPVFRSKLRGIKPKGLRPNKNSLKITPFDYHSEMNATDIQAALERLRIIGSE